MDDSYCSLFAKKLGNISHFLEIEIFRVTIYKNSLAHVHYVKSV